MARSRFYHSNTASADTSLVVEGETLDTAVSYEHSMDNGDANHGFQFLTIAWDHTNSAATALTFTAEISLDGTNYVDVTEAIIVSGADTLEAYNPEISVSGNATGTFSVPAAAARTCRVTCTATGGTASDEISWRSCAHD